MKGDFSRLTFDKKKNYSGVLMQQGRVQVDADWNEQQAIARHRDETETRDVVGPCGAPSEKPGFKITVKDGTKLVISAGRYYVDGILCENEQDVFYEDQPDLFESANIIDTLKNANTNMGLVYLDVWQRHITALDDPRIREKALGGPDTATRTKTVWQGKILPIKERSAVYGSIREKLETVQNTNVRKLTESFLKDAEKFTQEQDVKSQQKIMMSYKAKAQKMAAIAGLFSSDKEIIKNILDIAHEWEERPPAPRPQEPGKIICNEKIAAWDTLVTPSSGTLNVRTRPSSSTDNLCSLSPGAGYQGLENQLYRVEIHKGGEFAKDKVTFKWSRDNGSVVASIEKISGTEVTIKEISSSVPGFASNQWVEILDDRKELNGVPGQLVRISDDLGRPVLKMANTVTRLTDESNPDGVERSLHPKIRRWDSDGEIAVEIPTSNDGWISLGKDGIEVKFSGGTYRTGDYWLIPARTATGDIEWPHYEDPDAAQPPVGIHHHYCRLALIVVKGIRFSEVEVTDCRRIFLPLPEARKAIHIIGINWKNDWKYSLKNLPQELKNDQKYGQNYLEIEFDGHPLRESINSSSMIVAAEIPMGFKFSEADVTPDLTCIIDGEYIPDNNKPNIIRWIPTEKGQKTLRMIKVPRPPQKPASVQFRIRVTVKGHAIWSEQNGKRLYLDGQAFGQPAEQADKTWRTGLILPSGNGATASDFESWFYLKL